MNRKKRKQKIIMRFAFELRHAYRQPSHLMYQAFVYGAYSKLEHQEKRYGLNLRKAAKKSRKRDETAFSGSLKSQIQTVLNPV